MSKSAVIRFVLLSAIYWVIAFVAISVVSLRTCGMTPDSVELCDLSGIKIVSSLSLIAYCVLAAWFFFRSPGRS